MNVRDSVLEAVSLLQRRLRGSDVAWGVTGSANLAFRGAELAPRDLDVITDEAGAYAIAERCAPFVRREVTYAEAPERGIRSHFGALAVAGETVEVMGDVEHLVDGEWVSAGDVAAERESLAVAGLEEPVPVMSLRHERAGYADRGRDERVTAVDALIEDR